MRGCTFTNMHRSREPDSGLPRWVYEIETYLEKRKGEPMGPAGISLVGLAEDGTWFSHSDGKVYWVCGAPTLSADAPRDINQNWSDHIAHLIFPALMAI